MVSLDLYGGFIGCVDGVIYWVCYVIVCAGNVIEYGCSVNRCTVGVIRCAEGFRGFHFLTLKPPHKS